VLRDCVPGGGVGGSCDPLAGFSLIHEPDCLTRVDRARLDESGEVAEIDVSPAVFTTAKPTEWAELLRAASEAMPTGLVTDLLGAVDHPSVALYPKLSSQQDTEPWQVRFDGLDIGRVGSKGGTLRLASSNLDAPGRPRDQWRHVIGAPSVAFDHDMLAKTADTIRALIDAFTDKPGSVLNHGQPEHGLEAHVLSGRLHLTTGSGLPLRLAVPADDGVLRAAQFPTLWGDVTSPVRYLDALLADDQGRPWAVELKDQDAGGGHGSYLRAGIGQAVLYRHYIRNVDELAPWFTDLGLDRTC